MALPTGAAIQANGVLAPLVRAGGSEWDVGIARTTCFAAGLLLAAVGALALRRRDWPAWTGVAHGRARGAGADAALHAPPGGPASTRPQPWFFTNDSTYQIELGGDLLLDGRNPYGHDYSRSGMERFYTLRRHAPRTPCASARSRWSTTPTFPAPPSSGAVWRLLPSPLDDYRLFVALATLGGLAAALAFRAPLGWRLAIGALIAANPIAVRSTWFGQNDAPSITLMILAFALGHPRPRALGRGRARRSRAAQAVRGRGHPLPGDHACSRARSAAGRRPASSQASRCPGRPRRPRLRRRARRGGAAVPDRRPGRLLRRHREVRRGHLQDRGLRAVGHPRARRA
ncbi:MAG: hypothetical protein WKF40_05345 [Thermoleophilaceae bacterium]